MLPDPKSVQDYLACPRRECLLLHWPFVEEAALELDSWEWNGQRGTGHQSQEHKEREDQSRSHRGSEIPGWEVGLDSVGNQGAH